MKSWKTFFAALGKIIGIIIVLFAEYFVSWTGVCFAVWLITKLLGITYSLRITTGIWLAMMFISKFVESIGGKK